MNERPGRGLIAMSIVTIVWLLAARYLLPLAAAVAPMALQKAISWSSFRALSEVVTLLLGLALWQLAVDGGLPRLLGRRLAGRSLLSVVLASPLVWVGSTALAITLAMPTLMEELRTRGPGASRHNAGAFAAELTGSSLPSMILAGVVLAALSEELLFRGALWTTLDAALRRLLEEPAGTPDAEVEALRPPSRWRAALASGWGATLGAAVVFGLMHADLRGGVGIVRIVATTCLGLACGAARTLTGSIGAAVALHLVHNAVSLAHSRGAFAALGPVWYGVPAVLLGAAVVGTAGLATLRRSGGGRLAVGSSPGETS